MRSMQINEEYPQCPKCCRNLTALVDPEKCVLRFEQGKYVDAQEITCPRCNEIILVYKGDMGLWLCVVVTRQEVA